MTVRITHKQMIVIFILIAIFISLLSFMLGPAGSMYVTVGLVVIFIIFKLRQYVKGEKEND